MRENQLAPIVLFVFNRPECTKQTLNCLKQNRLSDQSELFIYADGPKQNSTKDEQRRIKKVRKIIRQDKWCKKVNIIEASTNKGLAASIINGVSVIVRRYGKVIVLEDDLLTTNSFLEYMNEGLKRYSKHDRVFQIVGYFIPIETTFKNESFFLPVTSTWGWATWDRAWQFFESNPTDYNLLDSDKQLQRKFNLDNSVPYANMLRAQMENKIDSWGIRWWWSVFKNQGICLYPDRTLIANVGFGDKATHTIGEIGDTNKFWSEDYEIDYFPEKIEINHTYFSKFKIYYKKINHKPLSSRLIKKFNKVFNSK